MKFNKSMFYVSIIIPQDIREKSYWGDYKNKIKEGFSNSIRAGTDYHDNGYISYEWAEFYTPEEAEECERALHKLFEEERCGGLMSLYKKA